MRGKTFERPHLRGQKWLLDSGQKTIVFAIDTNRRYIAINSALDWSIFVARFCAGVEYALFAYLSQCGSLSVPNSMLGRLQYRIFIAYTKD